MKTQSDIIAEIQDDIGDVKDRLSEWYSQSPNEINDGGYVAGALGKLDQACDCLDDALYFISKNV